MYFRRGTSSRRFILSFESLNLSTKQCFEDMLAVDVNCKSRIEVIISVRVFKLFLSLKPLLLSQGNLLFFQNICDRWRIDARDCTMTFSNRVNGLEQCTTKQLDGLTIKGVDRDTYLKLLQALDLPGSNRKDKPPTDEPKLKRIKTETPSDL